MEVRRILANALGIPKSKIRVEKPRIGGGFGAKQTVVAEVYSFSSGWTNISLSLAWFKSSTGFKTSYSTLISFIATSTTFNDGDF